MATIVKKTRTIFMSKNGLLHGWMFRRGKCVIRRKVNCSFPVLKGHFRDAPIPCNDNGVK